MKLPKIAIWSIFRDSAGAYFERYWRQIDALDYPRNRLRFYVVEGDSTDSTLAELQDWAATDSRVTVLKCDTGLPFYGSVVSQERFRILAQVSNTALDRIAADEWADMAMLIESDLTFEPDSIKRLLKNNPGGIIAPMIWYSVDGIDPYRFYDVWAFRHLDGSEFPSYMRTWYIANQPAQPFEVLSVGSFVMFPIAAIKAGARYNGEAIRGMVAQAGQLGHKVWCDPTTHILHPMDGRR